MLTVSKTLVEQDWQDCQSLARARILPISNKNVIETDFNWNTEGWRVVGQDDAIKTIHLLYSITHWHTLILTDTHWHSLTLSDTH